MSSGLATATANRHEIMVGNDGNGGSFIVSVELVRNVKRTWQRFALEIDTPSSQEHLLTNAKALILMKPSALAV